MTITRILKLSLEKVDRNVWVRYADSNYSCIFEYVITESRPKDAVRKEFSRADQTRDKCRKCAFLPDCTSFALCPRIDFHCRELREMKTLDKLIRIIEKKDRKYRRGYFNLLKEHHHET